MQVTIEGRDIQDNTPTKTKSNSTVRNLTIQDDSGSIQVALWNHHANSPVRNGDRICITHTSPRYNKYLQNLALNTSVNTTIEIKGEVQQETTMEIISIQEEEDQHSYTITGIYGEGDMIDLTMTQALVKSTWDETRTDNILQILDTQKNYDITYQGSIVTALSDAN